MPNRELMASICGKSLSDAEQLAKESGYAIRVRWADGVDLPLSPCKAKKRFNVCTIDGVVVQVAWYGLCE